MKKRIGKRMWKCLACLAAAAVVLAGGYAAYLSVEYTRIPDHMALEITEPQSRVLQAGEPYKATTWNVGFGAYDQDFSFFMDEGVMLDGTEVQGTMSRAANLETVERNTEQAISILQELDPDFILLQEVDTDSSRSYHVDQRALFCGAFPESASIFASNFHSGYLLYPVTKPHGSVESGLLTLSQYRVDAAVRRSYPVAEGFLEKFFDLDRCFTLLRLPVENGRELVLIHSHMSAYDEGGQIRRAQTELLCTVLNDEYQAGNYVIVGGDFNQSLGSMESVRPCRQQVPEWVHPFDASGLPDGFSVVQAENAADVPTCRSSDLPYVAGVNYTTVVDGFLVSENVTAEAVNLDTEFCCSDHNPVVLTFTLEP